MRGEGDDVGVDIDGTKEEGDADALEQDIDLEGDRASAKMLRLFDAQGCTRSRLVR